VLLRLGHFDSMPTGGGLVREVARTRVC
jgi:hypothetical protein